VNSPFHLHNLTQPDAARLLEETRLAIVVIGSVEQHGPHLPLGTDAVAALAVAERVAERLRAPILVASLVGVAPYHLQWPASLTLRPTTLMALLVDVCRGLRAAAAETVLFVNWHEGNTPTLRLAADEVQRDVGARVLIAETHVITNQLFPDEMEFTHAGAMETAGVLAYDQSLVHLERVRDEGDFVTGERGHELFRRRDVFPVLSDFRDIAPSGWYGRPHSVTAERAQQIFGRVAEHVIRQVGEIRTALERDREA
jgi:creatinine amidohydrolase